MGSGITECQWVLAVETSTMTSSVALVRHGEVIAERSVKTRRGHASKLLPMIDAVLTDGGIEIAEVDLIAVPIGPGSFTGIRIGISTMKAIAWARSIPMVGVSSLETLAAGTGRAGQTVVPVLDARKGEVFCAVYTLDEQGIPFPGMPPIAASPQTVLERVREHLDGREALFVGDGIRCYFDLFAHLPCLAPEWDLIRGVTMANLGRVHFLRNGSAANPAVQPLYLRRSDAEIQVGVPTGARETVILS